MSRPAALREHLTTDGLNLDDVPASKRGVTCYFCHAAASLPAGHEDNNDPLVLATDNSLFGPFDDPAPGTPHKGLYSPLLDGLTLASASMCGSCHDIQNMQGAHVERTFHEWQSTLFAGARGGRLRRMPHGRPRRPRVASHDARAATSRPCFPAVDLPATPFPPEAPQNEAQRAAAQALLDTVVQSTLCWNPLTSRFELTLDNVASGHAFPSGATPDRRAWVEIAAYAGDQTVYTSGEPLRCRSKVRRIRTSG